MVLIAPVLGHCSPFTFCNLARWKSLRFLCGLRSNLYHKVRKEQETNYVNDILLIWTFLSYLLFTIYKIVNVSYYLVLVVYIRITVQYLGHATRKPSFLVLDPV